MKTVLLVDTHALLHRSYHALPPMTTAAGEPVNAVYGFVTTTLKAIEEFKPEVVVACTDMPGGTKRAESFEDYKANRGEIDGDLVSQFPLVEEFCSLSQIPFVGLAGYEADDCIGTLAGKFEKEGYRVIVLSGDSDLLQLVSKNIEVYLLRRSLADMKLYGVSETLEKYGFAHDLIPEYKGLAGDTSDNIPGVKGVGPKTATDLIQKYGNLEGIYEHIDETKGALRTRLETDKENAFLSRTLGTIHTDLDIALPDTVDFIPTQMLPGLARFEFKKLAEKIQKSAAKPTKGKGKKSEEASEDSSMSLLDALVPDQTTDVTDILTEFLERLVHTRPTFVTHDAAAHTIALGQGAHEGKCRYQDASVSSKKALQHFLTSKESPKVLWDAKGVSHALGYSIRPVADDLHILCHLVLERVPVDFDAFLGLYEGTGTLAKMATGLSDLHTRLAAISASQPKEFTATRLYREVELPLIDILYRMEVAGILLNPTALATIAEALHKEVKQLTKKIYDQSGVEFNIASPKQLAEILFDTLKIPAAGVKKGKTGYSTAAGELEKLRMYPIVPLIEEYREVTKLLNTYVETLPFYQAADGRIHTTFDTVGAATGRLSSTDPNLQNIPIRSIWGARIRSAFVAPPGKSLVSVDYSQIELRIAAHLSGDSGMTAAFLANEDIHRTTAALVYDKAPAEVTDDERRTAKALNFGILYGMGSFGFAASAGIEQSAARDFITKYFERFPGVKKFMEHMKELVREHGYVETACGRRRYLPEIHAANRMMVAGAERIAINLPVQGLEADIMKIAMIAVDEVIAKEFATSATLLLQVHDELLFEVDNEALVVFTPRIQEVMAAVYPLSVPLSTSSGSAADWGSI
jgi:DNA polymerase-1